MPDYDIFGAENEIPKLREFDNEMEEVEEEEDFDKIEIKADDIEEINSEEEEGAPKKKETGGFTSLVNSSKLRQELEKELDDSSGGRPENEEQDRPAQPNEGIAEEDDLITLLAKYPKEAFDFIENWRKMGHSQLFKFFVEKPHKLKYLKQLQGELMGKVVDGTASQPEKVQLKELTDFNEGMNKLQRAYLEGVEYSPLHKSLGELWLKGKLKQMQASGKKYNTDLAFGLFMLSAEFKNAMKLEEIANSIPKVVINGK